MSNDEKSAAQVRQLSRIAEALEEICSATESICTDSDVRYQHHDTQWDRDFRAIVAAFIAGGNVLNYEDTGYVRTSAIWADDMAKIRRERKR